MLLKVRDVHKSYVAGAGIAKVLRGVSLDLQAGQSLALMGESGSGKSTLLHLIGGLDVPNKGAIHIGQDLMSDPSDSTRAQQRVAIARALAAKPALILADEPTGNLDEETAQNVLALLLEITRETGTALLMVTHSSSHASALDYQLHLRGGVIVP